MGVLRAPDVLLPDFSRVDASKWAVIACDQFTSEPGYWEQADACVGDSPSTLRLMLPEVYLSQAKERIPGIQKTMQEYLGAGLLKERKGTYIYVERVQSDGFVRKGLVVSVDLEAYAFEAGSQSPVRATEKTVLERIPPRVRIREGAALELPHVMLLADDPENKLFDVVTSHLGEKLYDCDLMLGGGHLTGYAVDPSAYDRIGEIVDSYGTENTYGKAPLSLAVGDGNHSLATAKTAYERIKQEIGQKAGESHPARFAMCEIVNLHDPALRFEPIYRVMFRVDPRDVAHAFRDYAKKLNGQAEAQEVTFVTGKSEEAVLVPHPEQQLVVGTVQTFIDGYLSSHSGAEVDYIHGEDSVRELTRPADTFGFLFQGMQKNELFKTVILDGSLPRKTFSMGHARDKRYYMEAHRIVP